MTGKGRWTAVLECEKAFTLLEELSEAVTSGDTDAIRKKNREVVKWFSELDPFAGPCIDCGLWDCTCIGGPRLHPTVSP